MPLTKITFEPGINKEATQYSIGPSWYDCDRIRFRKGRVDQIGGWVKPTMSVTFPVDELTGEVTSSFRGVARSLLDWGTATADRYLGIGTSTKFYVEIGGTMYDITPIRTTTTAGEVTFAATNLSSTLTVTDTGHGAAAGDYVRYSGAVTLGGTITADVLNHEYEIDTITDANIYTITARDVPQNIITANALDTNDGGASVVGVYQITTGTNNYVPGTGYSVGTYSSGPWGGGGALTFANQLRLYSQDIFADDLLFNGRAGDVFFWDESGGTGTRAVSLDSIGGSSDAPTVALQVMVSPVNRHVICFGCNPIGSADLDPLLIRWSDQESHIDWTPTAINTSGGQVLATGTQIIGAIKTRQEVLIFTDTSITAMRFSGAPFVFQFAPVGENVTIISPKAAISAGDAVFFMDLEGFYVYTGTVDRLSCSVLDYVFSNIDREQLHKVFASNNPDDSEVTWFYPITGGADVSRYVSYNYAENLWTVGTMDRGAWIQAPTKTYPVATSNDTVNLNTNFLYQQEIGYNADGANMGAYVESGDFGIGDGDSLAFLRRFLSDFRTTGTKNNAEWTVTIKGRNFPLDDLKTLSTSTVLATGTPQSHVRVRAREIVLRVDAQNFGYGWTMGDFRFDLRTDGRR